MATRPGFDKIALLKYTARIETIHLRDIFQGREASCNSDIAWPPDSLDLTSTDSLF